MVLGLRTKTKKGASVQVDYLVNVQEIKPWSPSESLRSFWSVLLQWENGDRNSGSTGPVVPSLGSGVGDGKIEFNESFRLIATLSREAPAKGGDVMTFRKNYLEFSLYEPRKDKTVKGQLLGTAIIDLAEYGIVKEAVNIGAPMHCKRSFQSTAQPVLFVRIQPFDKGNSSLLSLLNESSLDQEGTESISSWMSEEFEEVEIASFTDDDVSSHSSSNVPSSAVEASGASPPQIVEVPEKSEDKPVTAAHKSRRGSSRTSSIDPFSDTGSPENDHAAYFAGKSLTSTPKKSVTHNFQSSSASIAYEGKREEARPRYGTRNYDKNYSAQEEYHGQSSTGSCISEDLQIKDIHTDDLSASISSSYTGLNGFKKAGLIKSSDSHLKGKDNGHTTGQSRDETEKADATTGLLASLMEEQGETGQDEQIEKEKTFRTEDESSNLYSPDSADKQIACGGDMHSFSRRAFGVRGNVLSDDKLKHFKSVRSSDSLRSNSFADAKVQQLEHKIERLEGELREAAAIDIGLYSVVAEHGSSASKVHAPARRLSRLYLHALRKWSPARIASAARSAVSGLVLVAKACGNDVPRLTFWLSNVIVLRAVISQAIEELQLPMSAASRVENNGDEKVNNQRSSSLKWKESSPRKREKKYSLPGCFDDWEDPHTFISVLEKLEAWIFSRIIKSLWWQTLTPHMQSTIGKASDKNLGASSRKNYWRRSSLVDQDQGNFSLELWKKAFKSAYERLCPLRAGGHECGCLPVIARLVMQQCVARLDVAMFNAILRESGDEIPTDPVADPISDSKVLPILAGKASFGAGAQLKNAVGSWSRWLSDLFGIDDDDLPEGEKELNADDRQEHVTSFKPFNLLYALSDLMMLPKAMLLDSSIRKEVCPTFGAPLIRRVLLNFIPDEFCPDSIPEALFEALNAEDVSECEGQPTRNYPCPAAPIVYLPPSAASLAGFIGGLGGQLKLQRSGSVLRKSYTSDDELDELDSPLASIFDNFRDSPTSIVPSWKSEENDACNVIRYQLLREVWRDDD